MEQAQEEEAEAIDLGSNEDQSLNLDDESSKKVEILKRMVKRKMSIIICVFSLVILALYSLFPHNSFTIYYYYSTFLFSLLNHALQRKYMFLICNGILFVLATSSIIVQDSSSSSSSSFEPSCNSFSHIDDLHHDHDHDFVAAAIIEEESNNYCEDQYLEEQNQEEIINNRGHDDQLDEELDEEEEEDDDQELEEGNYYKGMSEDHQLEVVVSTEDLNKKIEEFIRKMKEEMRIEAAAAHQTPPLIAV